MANIVRQEMGLDAAQAIGGWKSRAIVEKIYTDAPSEWGQRAVNRVGELIEAGSRDLSSKASALVNLNCD